MGERGGLEFCRDLLVADVLWIGPGMGINEADLVVSGDNFGKSRVQLQDAQQVRPALGMIEALYLLAGLRQLQLPCHLVQDMPGNAVVFSI